jgi:hypothetical protein
LSGFASKVLLLFLFTPGFSQATNLRDDWKPFKRFSADSRSANTWLKPGVNETNSGGTLDRYF